MQRQAKPNWRLKKTLARPVDFRLLEREDVRYLWVAYKKGLLADLGGPFSDPPNMTPDEFKVEFEVLITTMYHGAWAMLAKTGNEYKPVGAVFGFWSHPEPKYATFMNVANMVWFPWATARNRIESALNFFNTIRMQFPMVEYAREKDKRFFEVLARHGVMRRIGTSYNVYCGAPAAVFETRSPETRS